MKKIDLVFFGLLTIGIISLINVEFKNSTGNIVNGCFDSDGGINALDGGNLRGFDGTSKRDSCVNGTTLYEYFCLDERSDGLIEEVYCEYGCVNEQGKGVCLEKNELTRADERFAECDDGCYSNGVCIDIGFRVNGGNYCSISEDLELQLLDGDACLNNFECRSNLCIVGNCISEKVFELFLKSLEPEASK